jgi:hypothetical protein
MVVLRFPDEAVRRDCCDPTHMRHRWGDARSRRISHRLQQLDAMTSIADLAFLPLDSHVVGGVVEVEVDDGLTLLLDVPSTPDEEGLMTVLVIRTLRLRSTATSP